MGREDYSRSGRIDWPTLTRSLRPENSPGYLLWQVTNRWQRALRAALEPFGLTHVQFILLAGLGWLEAKEGEVSQTRLAQFGRLDAMMTSQVLRTLARAGLVERAAHPRDHRAKAVRLTDTGADTLNRALPAVHAADRDFFASLDTGQAAFVETLRQLWQHAPYHRPGETAPRPSGDAAKPPSQP